MANTDKNIVITPNTGDANAPNIVFSGANTTVANQDVKLTALPDANGTVLFSASTGNLVKIQNSQTESLVATSANITGNLTANYLLGNGSQLAGVVATSANSLANGTSNVNIPASGGNVNTSVGGTSNVLVVTSTGANITGTLNATGNANTGNIGATNAVFTNISGTLTTASQTNITSVGTLGNLTVTGNTTSGNFVGVFANGTSNVSIPASGGNVNTSVGGTANVLVVTSAGANITGTLNATGNANTGNIGATTGVFTNISGTLTTASQTNITTVGTLGNLTVTGNTTSGNFVGTLANGTSNIAIPAAGGNINLTAGGGTPELVITATGVNVTGTFNTGTGNANVGNLGTTGNITAGYFFGNGSQLTGVTATASTLANGTSNISIPAASGNVNTSVGGVANIFVVTSGGANITGNLSVNTAISLGTGNGGTFSGANLVSANFFTGTFANGTSNIAIPAASGNINLTAGGGTPELVVTTTGVNVTGTFNTGTGNANVGNLGTTGNITAGFYFGNGSQLTGITATTASSLANGTSNVTIPAAGGNVNTSVGGTSNVLVVTATGANITGTLNATGNANTGNIGATNAVFTNIAGTLTTASQTNITAVGTLGNLTVTSNTTSGNFIGLFANGNSNIAIASAGSNVVVGVAGNAAILTVTGSGVNVFGTLNTGTGNATVGNLLSPNGGIYIAKGVMTATAAPTADMFTITNSGNGVTTSGVSALQVTYVGGAAAIESSAYRTDLTPGGTTGGTWNGFRMVATSNAATGVTMNAVKIDSLPSSGAGTENALYVGANWDNVLNYNGTPVIFGNGTVNAAQVSGTVPSATNAAAVQTNASTATTVYPTFVTASTNANYGLNTVSGISANLANNSITATTFVGTLSGSVTSLANGTSNVSIPASGGNVNTSVGGTANVLVVTSTGANITGTLNATGNANTGNIGATNGVFTNISGTLTTASQTNITAVGTLGNLTVTSNTTSGNFIGVFANGNSNIAIASAGSNVVVSVAGNAGILTVTGTGVNVFGTLNTGTGNANVGNLGTTGNITAGYFFGNGSQLTGITATTASSLANGTSNVSIPASGGNVNTSVGGTSNVLVVTSTGINVAGTLNTGTGNATVGNLIGVHANGNSNVNIATAGGNVTVGVAGNAGILTVTGTGVNVFGTLNTGTGNANVGNIGATTGIFTTINGVLANGTSNVSIPASGGNINISRGGTANVLVITGTGINVAGTLNTGTGNANVGNISTQTSGRVITPTLISQETWNLNIYTPTPGSANVIAPDIVMRPGSGNGTGSGGAIYLTGGHSSNTSGSSFGGAVIITGGSANTNGAGGGFIDIRGGPGTSGGVTPGDVYISSGEDTSKGTVGTASLYLDPSFTPHRVYLAAGSANGTNLIGGDALIDAGLGTGTGTPGNIIFRTANALQASGNASQSSVDRVTITYTGMNVNAATNSTSTTTGALIVGGGVGITGNLYAGGIANITGNANVGNLGTTGNITAGYFFGNGSQLTGITAGSASSIANGTSNVSIPASGGNVNTSVGGTANVLVVTSTGINVAGTLNTGTGNATVGNLIGVYANGNSNVNIATAGGNVTVGVAGNAAILTVTGTGVNVFGTLNTGTGNANVGNLGTAGLITATGNVSGGNLLTAANIRTSNTTGGPLYILGSTGTTGNVNGGLIQIQAGEGFGTGASGNTRGGAVNIYAGNGVATSGIGGNINIRAGNNNADGGGTVWINAGDGNSSGTSGGAVYIQSGNGVFNNNGGGGNIDILAGKGSISPGGTIYMQAGRMAADTGAFITMYGTSTSNVGQDIELSAGDGGGTNNKGGNAIIYGGYATGNATPGQIQFYTSNGTGTSGTTRQSGVQRASITYTGLTVNAATNSTSTTTGALIVGGGVGITGNLYAGGIANITGNLTTTGNVRAGNTTTNAPVWSVTGYTTQVQAGIWNSGLLGTSSMGLGMYGVTGSTSKVSINLLRSNGAPTGTFGALGTNDTVGSIDFTGDNGTAYYPIAAISGRVDGNVGTGGIAGQLQFWTTTANTDVPSVRMIINNNGNIGIANTAPIHTLSVTGTLNVSSNANVGNLGSGNIFATGNVGAGISNPQANLHVANKAIIEGSAGVSILQIQKTGNTDNNIWQLKTFDTTGTLRLQALNDANTGGGSVLDFYRANNQITGASLTTNSTIDAFRITQLGTGNAIKVEDVTNPDASPFLVDNTGNVGIGNVAPTDKLSIDGNAYLTGNVTASYYIGNGSLLTGITASAGTSIVNGTSNVSIPASGGNVNISVGGTANVLVVTSTGANITGTLNTGTGNANVGNIGATDGVFTTLSGFMNPTAGTTATAPIDFTAGSLLTTPIAGAMEYDANAVYFTNSTTSGRAVIPTTQMYRITANSSTIGPTIADFFPATSSFQFEANSFYKIEAMAYFTKTTAGTATWAWNTSGTLNLFKSYYVASPVTGFLAGTANTGAAIAGHAVINGGATANLAHGATASLTSAVQHAFYFNAQMYSNAAGNIRLRLTQSAGTATPLAGSWYSVTKLPTNSGNFIA